MTPTEPTRATRAYLRKSAETTAALRAAVKPLKAKQRREAIARAAVRQGRA